MTRLRATTLVITFVALWSIAATAPDGPAPGLKLSIESGGAKDLRDARLITLRVGAGQPVSPFFPAGAFKATWDGNLALRIKDEYVFSARGRGALKLSINDQVVLDVSG